MALLLAPARLAAEEEVVFVRAGDQTVTLDDYRAAAEVIELRHDDYVGTGASGEEEYFRRSLLRLLADRRLATAFDQAGTTLDAATLASAEWRLRGRLVAEVSREQLTVAAQATVEEVRAEYDRIVAARPEGSPAPPSFLDASTRVRMAVESRKRDALEAEWRAASEARHAFEWRVDPDSPATIEALAATAEGDTPLFALGGEIVSSLDLQGWLAAHGESRPSPFILHRFADFQLFLADARARGLDESEAAARRRGALLNHLKAEAFLDAHTATIEERVELVGEQLDPAAIAWDEEAIAPYAL